MSKKFTSQDLKIIKKLNREGWNDKKIAKFLNKSQSGVRNYRKDMNLPNRITIGAEEEEKIRKYNQQGLSDNQIAQKLNRCRDVINKHRRNMNLLPGAYFSQQELDQIKELNYQGYNDQNIADILERSVDRIRIHRINLILPTRSLNTDMSKQKKIKKIMQYRKKNREEHVSYSQRLNQGRAALLGWPGYQINEALILYTIVNHTVLTKDQLAEKVKQKREYEQWKPLTLSQKRFERYVGHLNREGMIKIRYKGVYPEQYILTQKAKEELRSTKRIQNLEETIQD